MATSEERLKRKRSAMRAATTRLLTKADHELQETEVDCALLDEILAQLAAKEISLDELDKEIEELIVDLDDLENEVANREEYKERIVSGKTRLGRRLRSEDVATPGERGRDDIPPIAVVDSGGQRQAARVKLPRLKIDSFGGDASAWQTFWAQYCASIHENEGLNEVDKFNYLKSLLEGSASRAISGLPLTAENYTKAIDILRGRFGRRDIIINAHMNALLNLNPIKKANDYRALRKLYDECEVQIRSLESLGMVAGAYGGLLCPLLFKVIPDELALEFNRRREGDEELTVDKLLAFIRKEVESLESTHLLAKREEIESKPKISNSAVLERPRFKHTQPSRTATASALNVVVEEICVFCDNSAHSADDCKEYDLNKKKDILRERGRCFICLKKRHLARNCRSSVKCPTCQKRHRKALCHFEHGAKEAKESLVVSLVPDSGCAKNAVLLQTVQARAVGAHEESDVRCLLDGGSHRTFIREDLSRMLKLRVVGEEVLNIHTFGKETPINERRRRVILKLCSKTDGKSIEIEALETPEICATSIQFPDIQMKHLVGRLGLQLSDTVKRSGEKTPITILIGSDYYWRIVTGNFKRLTDSLVAMETLFGWSVQGPTVHSEFSGCTGVIATMKVAVHSEENEEREASAQLRKFWELDSLGIREQQEKPAITEDEAYQNFNATVAFMDGRYEVRLPWKTENESWPNGFDMANKRLESLTKRFRNNPLLYVEYKEAIEQYLKQGVAEEVGPDDRAWNEQGNLYYLPHQAVIRHDKSTTKVRIVFDASAHEPGCPSLNELLHPGPNLNPDVIDLLIKFRMNRIAFVSDIEKAFLQIQLAKEDRDAVRFLWMEGVPEDRESPIKIRILRMTRILFGVTSSPFLLSAVIKHHTAEYKDECPRAYQMLNDSMYVDDVIDGASDIEEAFQATSEAKQIMGAANMLLRKWRTNSRELETMWKDASFDVDLPEETNGKASCSTKVLGLIWNTQSDTFHFDFSSLLKFLVHNRRTKRNVLQAAGRIFDPVGFLSPFTIRVKMLFQALWVKGLKWDDELPDDVKGEWQQWCQELSTLVQVEIPRYYFAMAIDEKPTEMQLHCFVDASAKAYGAVAYIRYCTNSNSTMTTFLAAKTRVAPLKRLSIPRLELMGALLGARLLAYLKKCLWPEKDIITHFWTDSTIVLCWIRSPSDKWKPFVGNRVREIQGLSEPSDWQHCPGIDNPADWVTRGQELTALVSNDQWWSGPPWLKQSAEEWPQMSSCIINQLAQGDEKERQEVRTWLGVVAAAHSDALLLDPERHSNLNKLIRVTAWTMRFVNKARKRDRQATGALSLKEIKTAEAYWIKQVQEQGFKTERRALLCGEEVNKSSRIFANNPFVDQEGLMRVGGRLQLRREAPDFNTRQMSFHDTPNKRQPREGSARRCSSYDYTAPWALLGFESATASQIGFKMLSYL